MFIRTIVTDQGIDQDTTGSKATFSFDPTDGKSAEDVGSDVRFYISGSQTQFATASYSPTDVLVTGDLHDSGSIVVDKGGYFAGDNFEFSGSVSITGSLEIDADTVEISGSLYVSGTTEFLGSLVEITGTLIVSGGLSGSLQTLADGSPYLVAGPNITLFTNSLGQVEITASAGGGGELYWYSALQDEIYTTGSVRIDSGSFAQGPDAESTGLRSFAHGSGSRAWGDYSHSEGAFARASGSFSHAEGYSTYVVDGMPSQPSYNSDPSYGTLPTSPNPGDYAHAEGILTWAVGIGSHAEGVASYTIGKYSHVEGNRTWASGTGSHAEGHYTVAFGNYSHAEGLATIASGSYQHVAGKFNQRGNDFSLFVIGDGTDDYDNTRSDIIRVNSGSLPGFGQLQVTGSIAVSGSYLLNVVSGTTTVYNVGLADHVVVFTATNVTGVLNPGSLVGAQVIFKDGGAGGGQLLSASSGEIDGSSTYSMTASPNASATLIKVNDSPETWIVV